MPDGPPATQPPGSPEERPEAVPPGVVAPPAGAQHGTPGRGTRCLVCAYNLVGLEPSDHCPECGSPVSRSLGAAYLRRANPDYIRTLLTGIIVAEISVVVYVLSRAVPPTLVQISSWTGWSLSLGLPPVAGELVTLGATVAMVAGWFLFTTPDPVIGLVDPARQARKLVRWCVLLTFLGAAVDLAGATGVVAGLRAGAAAGGQRIALGVAVGALMSMGWIGAIGLFFSGAWYIGLVAVRAEHRPLALDARRALWLVPLVAVVGARVLLGPMIAFFLYFWLLDHTRRTVARAYRASLTGA